MKIPEWRRKDPRFMSVLEATANEMGMTKEEVYYHINSFYKAVKSNLFIKDMPVRLPAFGTLEPKPIKRKSLKAKEA